MAIRERKGRAKPWQCYWNNLFTGKRESESFATRMEAEKKDSLVKHQLKFDRESFRKEEVVQEERAVTLNDIYMFYLAEKQFRPERLMKHLSGMRPALRRLGNLSPAEIAKKDLEELLAEMRLSGVKLITAVDRMKRLNTLFRWAVEKELCAPVAFIKLPCAQYEKFMPSTPQELERMLDAALPHVRRVIILGAQCGVRIGVCELFQMTWQDVDLENRILRIHGSHKNPHAPWREVPIRESLAPVLEAWRKEDRAAGVEWLISYNGKPVKSIHCA